MAKQNPCNTIFNIKYIYVILFQNKLYAKIYILPVIMSLTMKRTPVKITIYRFVSD